MPVVLQQPNVASVILAGQHHPEQLLGFMAQALPRFRYHFEARGPNWLRANRLPPFAAEILYKPHSLVVESDGSGVRITFEYHPQVRVAPGETLQIERFAAALLGDFNSYAIAQSFQGPPPSYGYPPPPSGYGPPSSHVVERQVVVVRCKFCQAHTPLDGPRCASCGAERFS